MRPIATFAVAAVLLATAMPSASNANIRRLRSHYTPGEVIVAHSHFGNGSVTGIVRPGEYGWEVQLPGGAWTGCRRSCEETLRVQTVDVFGDGSNTLSDGGYGTLQRECGIFGCLGGHLEFSF